MATRAGGLGAGRKADELAVDQARVDVGREAGVLMRVQAHRVGRRDTEHAAPLRRLREGRRREHQRAHQGDDGEESSRSNHAAGLVEGSGPSLVGHARAFGGESVSAMPAAAIGPSAAMPKRVAPVSAATAGVAAWESPVALATMPAPAAPKAIAKS